jgi:hypothetical protein
MEHFELFVLPKSISCTAWFDCLFKFQVDQAVSYCSHYFGSGCWLLFPLYWIRLLVTVPVILDQAVGYLTAWSKIIGTVTNSLVQNNSNSNQQPDPK